MDIWDIIRPFGTFCVHFVHFYGFGIMYQEKSGNPESKSTSQIAGENDGKTASGSWSHVWSQNQTNFTQNETLTV
jgi:hypothetical protein